MSAKSVKRGELTAGAARVLRDGWESKGWDILFDLGKAGTHLPGHVGEIVSWFGDEIKQERRLAYPDIAMVKRNQEDRVFALIEIEESSARPKVLLGDLFATLLGDHIKFKERILQVGEWTNFILLAHGQAHSEQIAFIQEKVAGLKPYISSSNASIGRLILDTYENKLDLELKVTQRVEEALKMETNKRDQI